MGRLEKIVVLTVLFLVAVVLGVALNSDSPNSGAAAKGSAQPELGTSPVKGFGAKVPGVLSADALREGTPTADPAPGVPVAPETKPSVPEVAPAPVAPVSNAYLLTREGLTATPHSADMMFYTWKEGDSFAAVAQRYYGSADKLTRLQKVNEGQSDASLSAGDMIWVQVTAPVDVAAIPVVAGGAATTYVVKKGDVLGTISQHFYGTSKKWQKILDANSDQLASPDRLQVGMKLRIPE
jgi:nucleoid-associated protein YgaU